MSDELAETLQLLETARADPNWLPLRRLRVARCLAAGKDPDEVARELGIDRRFVASTRKLLDEQGLKGLFSAAAMPEGRPEQLLSNLVSARVAENLFPLLMAELGGIEWVDVRGQHSGADFEAYRNGQLVSAWNVKVHSAKFLAADRFVGLPPDDTFPLALYKILTGYRYQSQRKVPFIFAVSIDWGIADRILQSIPPEMRAAVPLVFGSRVPGKRSAEDRLVGAIVDHLRSAGQWEILLEHLRREGNHRAISAKRALEIFMTSFERRCPALSLREFASKFPGRRGIPGEINMHFSITSEMLPLSEVVERWRQGSDVSFAFEVLEGLV